MIKPTKGQFLIVTWLAFCCTAGTATGARDEYERRTESADRR
jgi:hypothetical protein